jgi:glutamate-1-semialdehyde aminotransferase
MHLLGEMLLEPVGACIRQGILEVPMTPWDGPAEGFYAGLRRLTREDGTLLAIDETQTLPMAFGGLVRQWGPQADLVILGKSLGGGVPVAALGMTEEISAMIDREYAQYEVSGEAVDEPAIGGTLFGNALSMGGVARGVDPGDASAHAGARARPRGRN